MGSEMKLGKSLKNWAQRYINIGFAIGFFLVLLTYFIVSQQFALTSPNVVSSHGPRIGGSTKTVEEEVIKASKGKGIQYDQGEEKIEAKPEAFEAVHHEPERTEKSDGEKRERDMKPKGGEVSQKDTAGAVPTVESPRKEQTDAKPFGTEKNAKVVCDTANPISDTCNVDGDVRTNGTSLTVTLVPATWSQNQEHREWKIRPYSRKTMSNIKEVTVTQLASPQESPPCTATHNVPAVVFALGGLIGNYWHDFSDMLVPLFIASRKYEGEVQFLVSNIQPWWLGKYEAIIRRLSKYDAIDLDGDKQIRCFRHVTVGLRMHKEFSIVPEWAPGGYSMVDFTRFLRETYALPRGAPTGLKQSPTGKRPRLLLIHRGHYRKFVNVPEIVQLAERVGFEAVVIDPKFDVRIADFAKTVNSFDVLLGVHGAGLTNAVFLPANAVVVQVVPYGKLEHMAKVDFGDPVVDMGHKYLEYSISAEESTLLEMLGREHQVIKDPESVHRSGWDKVAEFYLGKQDVRIDVNRFAPTLFQALDHLRQL